jgi:glutaredoxin
MLHLRLILLALCLFTTLGADAEIFTWKDAQGRTQFGDRPPAESHPKAVELQINSVDRPELKTPTGSGPRVVIYTAEWCGVCRNAKRYLQKKGVSYQEFDVDKSPKGRRDYKQLKGTGVPIILVGEKRMNGFSPDRFESIYQTP